MSQTPELLSPERLAEIRRRLPVIPRDQMSLTEQDRADLLGQIAAREAQIREALVGLFVYACVVDSRGPITQDDILAAAQRLGITL